MTREEKDNELLALWEAMFGNSMSAKAGVYTVEYKQFMQLIDKYTQAKVDEYHNQITDNEKKVWITRKQYEERVLEARIDEVEHFIADNDGNEYYVTPYPQDDITIDQHLSDLEAELSKLKEEE